MDEKESIKLQCIVEHIVYQCETNGYTVLRVSDKKDDRLITAVGYFSGIKIGAMLLISGTWKKDPKYGFQFKVQTWEETFPATAEGIEKYLGSGLIKGIGAQMANRMVEYFGEKTLSIIETESARLTEVEGIGKKRMQQIRESWEAQREIKNVMLFLQGYGISTCYAVQIYKQYGKESIAKVKKNPYILANDIWGIGFKTADSIAQRMGIDREAYIHLKNGILYTLNEHANEGHVYSTKDQLLYKAEDILDVDASCLADAVARMSLDNELILQEVFRDSKSIQTVYLKKYYYAEQTVACRLTQLLRTPAGDKLWDSSNTIDIQTIQEQLHIEYDEIQADAIRQAAISKVMVLTGGPGTGKSTTIQGIITAYLKHGLQIQLAAPTGRAAKRMTETTGMEAKTIHRLLEYSPQNGYQRNESSPLSGDVLIVDESSMIDISLMSNLLNAVPDSMRLILIGDIDQLPSVGPGNVLRDVIYSKCVPVVNLTRIFRQAQSSRIVMNAHKVNKGIMPDISNGMNTDFFFLTRENPEDAARTIVTLVSDNLPKCYGVDPTQIQVLSPMKKVSQVP